MRGIELRLKRLDPRGLQQARQNGGRHITKEDLIICDVPKELAGLPGRRPDVVTSQAGVVVLIRNLAGGFEQHGYFFFGALGPDKDVMRFTREPSSTSAILLASRVGVFERAPHAGQAGRSRRREDYVLGLTRSVCCLTEERPNPRGGVQRPSSACRDRL